MQPNRRINIFIKHVQIFARFDAAAQTQSTCISQHAWKAQSVGRSTCSTFYFLCRVVDFDFRSVPGVASRRHLRERAMSGLELGGNEDEKEGLSVMRACYGAHGS